MVQFEGDDFSLRSYKKCYGGLTVTSEFASLIRSGNYCRAELKSSSIAIITVF